MSAGAEEAAVTGTPPAGRQAALLAVLWVVTLEAWFQGPLLGGRVPPQAAALPALALLVLAARQATRALRRSRPEAAPDRRRLVLLAGGIMLLATAFRLPALLAPAGLLSSDSAVAGILAQDLRAGILPAPIYAPGFPYEGTLKPHLTAALALFMPGAPLVYAYTIASHLLYLLWMAAVMLLAFQVAGLVAAGGAGAFMAVSPRFLTAFSLNNVGQYPDVNALGALALALLALGAGPGAAAFCVGLAVWQQLLGIYFVLVLGMALLATPALRTARALGAAALGFLAGSYPLWVWNAAHGFATFDFVRRGGKNPGDRLASLPDRLDRTLQVSLPKLFGATDLGLEGVLAVLFGVALPAAIVALAVARRREMAALRGRSAVFLITVLAVVVVGLFATSKFSNRGASRPRYLMPLYTPAAIAFGWGLAALSRRSRAAAALAGVAVLGANASGTWSWLAGRQPSHAADQALVTTLTDLGVRRGYAGFWVAPKTTFLADGRLVLSGELGPDVSWVYARHSAEVRVHGPDAFVVAGGPLADAFAARLEALGCSYHLTRLPGHAVFWGLGRRLALEDVEGYDAAVGARAPAESGEDGPAEGAEP